MTKRNVLIITDGDDMAGVGYGLKKAFDTYSTKYQLRQVRGTNNYIDYPVDITWPGRNTFVNELYNEADLIHISEYPWALDGANAPRIWEQVPKPTVVHQHGTPFRNNPANFLRLARQGRFTQIVSTIDLLVDPSLQWLPNPVDIEVMQQIRKERYPNDGIIRLGQAPTNQGIKNTKEYVHAALDLQKRYGIEYLVIEKQKWVDCLAEKARTDIWFDQLTYGYGSNAIEAGAMGIPLVGGFTSPQDEQRLVDQVGGLPFVPATVDTLPAVLDRLVRDADYRNAKGRQAYLYMSSVHSEPVVVAKLEGIYDRTINEFEARNGRAS